MVNHQLQVGSLPDRTNDALSLITSASKLPMANATFGSTFASLNNRLKVN
jgi:hypothetical protein